MQHYRKRDYIIEKQIQSSQPIMKKGSNFSQYKGEIPIPLIVSLGRISFIRDTSYKIFNWQYQNYKGIPFNLYQDDLHLTGLKKI